MKVIIVGGGIGGLAAYHALKTYAPDVTVTVYDAYTPKPDTAPVLGGGIGVVANGIRALSRISPTAVTSIYKNGFNAPYFNVRNDGGSTLGQMGRGWDRLMLSRAAVHDSLLLDVPEGALVTGKKIVEVKETAEKATVVFEDGHVEDCDLVLGADGVRSICRTTVFGPEASKYDPKYDGLTAIGGFVPLASLSPRVQDGVKADYAAMTFGRDGFFGYSLSLPLEASAEEQQLMWWSTYAVDTPPEREQPPSDIRTTLLSKHAQWASPHGPTLFQNIIEAACGNFEAQGRFTKWLVLPRFQTARLPRWTSDHARVILLGDAAHTQSPDSGQGASMAIEDAQMLGVLIRHFTQDGAQPSEESLQKVRTAYETIRMPRIDRILRLGRQGGNRKRRLSWFAAKLRDLALWVFCRMPGWVMKRFNAVYLYDVDVEVANYLASGQA